LEVFMRHRIVIAAASFISAALVGTACGKVITLPATGGTGGTGGAIVTGGGDTGNSGTGGATGPGSSSTSTLQVSEAGPHCIGLQCVASSDACAAQGKPPTTISGVVYDPAGALPLYNVYVYVPNQKPDPIVPGNPTCTSCQAPASGSPVIGASTDKDGKFTLSQGPGDTWGVPSGDNLPLVLQIGKWRRQLVMPHIDACADNPLPDSPTPSQKLRLPAKTSEGDMPYIAFTSGCDPAECFLRHVGIDDSEFVPPGSAGGGHVVFYTGQDANSLGANGSGSQIAGGNTWSETYTWWADVADLKQYDLVFDACECNANDRGAGAYQAMHDYVAGGGRLLSSHYYYNWLAPPTGPTDFQGVVSWALPEGIGPSYQNYYVDMSFPKGQAFGGWLQDLGVTTTLGVITLADTRYDMNGVNPGTTRWLYNADAVGADAGSYATMLMSFNGPVGQPPASQCGRVMFSDVHISGTSDDSTFPNECAGADPDGSHAVNEKAQEFLFFDLFSCVQDDTQPPVPIPQQ
jgi:hypothetical protein